MSEIAREEAEALLEQFADATTAVLSQIAGESLTTERSEVGSATDAAMVIGVAMTGALEGNFEIALSAQATAQFSALLTGEAAPHPVGEISSDQREAAAELIQQICGNAADRLRRSFGPLELKPSPAERSGESGKRQTFHIPHKDKALEFELHIVRLASELRPQQADAAVAEAAPHQPVIQASSLAQSSAQNSVPLPALSPPMNRNLDLLLDVELAVTLRFGSRQMLLKEVIDLCSGSVVELDRRVQEPVDLLIDGRLIAQGDVVLVGGNYGIRVTKVASSRDKIACLP